MAITTYRWAFREVIHEATGIAWELYRADIKKLDPEATPAGFVFDLSRGDFEKQFGDAYRRPGSFFRFIGFLGKLVPNVGPLRRLPYRPLPPHVQQLFVDALERCVVRYQTTVPHGAAGRVALVLVNENLDIGRPTGPGEYEPADETYTRLLETLDRKSYAGVPRSVRDAILRFYEDPKAAAFVEKHPKEWLKVSSALARLDAAPLGP